MIVVKLKGGLGNQMFQYALGTHLAAIHKTRLFLDLSVYYNSVSRPDFTLRDYDLGVFNTSDNLVLPPNIPFLKGKLSKRISNVLHKIRQYISLKVINEKNFHFDKGILESPDDIYLIGYWHSEKYFKAIEPAIRAAFSLKKPISEKAEKIGSQIKNAQSVSLHIRRGDYLANTWAQKTFHILDENYYNKAIDFMENETRESKYFIFSDEPEWVKKNLRLPKDSIFVSGNKNFEDLYLMSLCKHNVIANSSFSWWGAWLNANPDKVVIAPQNWFKDVSKDTRDLIPENWFKI